MAATRFEFGARRLCRFCFSLSLFLCVSVEVLPRSTRRVRCLGWSLAVLLFFVLPLPGSGFRFVQLFCVLLEWIPNTNTLFFKSVETGLASVRSDFLRQFFEDSR